MYRVLIMCLLGLSSCATIIHGTKQDVGMSSTPTGATLTVDQIPHGTTPAVVPLARNSNHTVRMELTGFQPFEATITHSVSGWIAGNIAIGGLIGLGVDAVSGAMFTLTPEQIAAVLVPEASRDQQPASLVSIPVPPGAPAVGAPPTTYVPHASPVLEMPAVSSAPPVGIPTVQTRNAGVRLFLQPHPQAERLSLLGAGMVLRVIEDRETWLYVQTPDERRGWIAREWTQQ